MYGCGAHIEEILDVFLDETEEMPIMEEIRDDQFLCDECQEQAFYRLLGSDVKATWE